MLNFIKRHLGSIIAFLGAVIIFNCIFSLYGLFAEPVAYGTIVVCLFGVIIFTIAFLRDRRQLNQLKRVTNLSSFDILSLPEPKGDIENEYSKIIKRLNDELSEVLTLYQNDKKDSIDYYTTWVHQIKTPIAVMRMILTSSDTEENRNLNAELFRVEQYVEMVLNYIRLGSLFNDFVFKQVNLDEVIKEAVRKYAGQFIKSKLSLKYESKDVYVLTDKKWLLFIIEQLLSNAVKYTYSGGVEITVTDNKMLSIKDTGIGISMEDLPRVFEKRYTGYNGRENTKATGLGLYLVKTTADRLGIKITAESTPGEGSTFTLDLNTYDIKPE